MPSDAAILELCRRTADAADDAKTAAQSVNALVVQLDARVSRLESAERTTPPPAPPSLSHRLLDAVVAKPLLLLYLGLGVGTAVGLAEGGPAAVSLATALLPGGADASPAAHP